MRSGPRQREHRTGEHVMTQYTDLKYGPRRGKELRKSGRDTSPREERRAASAPRARRARHLGRMPVLLICSCSCPWRRAEPGALLGRPAAGGRNAPAWERRLGRPEQWPQASAAQRHRAE